MIHIDTCSQQNGISVDVKSLISAIDLHTTTRGLGTLTNLSKEDDVLLLLTNNPGRFHAVSEITILGDSEKDSLKVSLNYLILTLIRSKLSGVDICTMLCNNGLILRWSNKGTYSILKTAVLNI